MEIRSSFIKRSGETIETAYRDIDSYQEFFEHPVTAVHGFCFEGDKLVVVYSEKKGYWGPPGGGVEDGESIEEATIREILEETNMRVISMQPIGALTIFESAGPRVHVRSFCRVEPIGPFSSDPDGDVTEIRLIEPETYKEYFDWGEVGEAQFKRARELCKHHLIQDQ